MKQLNIFNLGKLVLTLALITLLNTNSWATIFTIDLVLSGSKEVPANSSSATGTLIGTYNNVTHVLTFSLMFNGLAAPATAAHFHAPAAAGTNGPVTIGFAGFPTGVTSGSYSNSYTLTPAQETQLLCGNMYVNIHNSVYPGGELRSQVKEGTTSGIISTIDVAVVGQKENPSNASTATATLIGTFNSATSVLSFTFRFNGLSAPSSAAHFHGPAAPGTNAPVLIGFAGFPTGVTSGVYSNSYTLTPTQRTYFQSGLLYVNIHNSVFPGGELRGQLKEGTLIGDCGVNVPTMSQWSLIILALLSMSFGLLFIYKRQHTYSVAGADTKQTMKVSMFDKTLFSKVLAATIAFAVACLFVVYFYNHHVSLVDTVGAIVSAVIIAFITQFILLTHNRS